MKKWMLIVTMLMVIGVGSAQARVGNPQYQYGFGMMVGEPTGLTAKFWINNKEAYDVAVSFRFSDYFLIQGGYLYHNSDVFKKTKAHPQASLYYGGGLRLIFDSDHEFRKHYDRDYDSILGIKGTVGLNYILRDLPVELFVEVSPIMNIVPATDLDFGAGIGARILW